MSKESQRLIIGLAVSLWILGIVLSKVKLPAQIEFVFAVIAVFVITGVVFSTMAKESGWKQLAAKYRATSVPAEIKWQPCQTCHVSKVSVDEPEYQTSKTAFVSTLAVGATNDAIYFTTLFSKIPGLSHFLPTLAIPWASVAATKDYNAGGWVNAPMRDGAIIQATFDPGYTGNFTQLAVGEPTVFIQLPADFVPAQVARS